MKICICVASLVLLTSNLAAQDMDIPRCGTAKAEPATKPVFVVSMFGNVVGRPTVAVTEHDDVLVRVLTDPTVAKGISVHRISAARRLGELRVIGATQTADVKAFNEVLAAAGTPTCYVDAKLGDFEAGLGQVEIRHISLNQAEVKQLTLGAFDFNVEPLYAGMFSLGPVVTNLPEPQYSVATNSSGGSYISAAESGDNRILYALIYTPFILGKRLGEPALRGERVSRLRRVNPMFGVVLDDISRNALVGVSIDFPSGIIGHYGAHIGRTSEIDPESGLTAGSAIASDGTIPVIRKWNSDRFIGVTLDARVALKLIGLAGKTTVP